MPGSKPGALDLLATPLCIRVSGCIQQRRARRTGRDPRVQRYIRSFKQTGEFLKRVQGLLLYLLPHYIREGKSYLTVAFGCTGGRHRSVMMAEVVARALKKKGFESRVMHRDADRAPM